jgi:hypothetical protein
MPSTDPVSVHDGPDEGLMHSATYETQEAVDTIVSWIRAI